MSEVRQLYSNDNWAIRRKLLFRLIYGQCVAVLTILIAAIYRGIENSLLELAVPAMLTSISALATAYIFGSNQDDKNKREQLPRIIKKMSAEDQHALTPPDDWITENADNN